ncbi:hypothetical protein BGK67_14010 [Streptomyces subrutilus]|uniref:Uncharacterized protein n=1 Tax=Streptomyces subrutilus TaxID=36818 RepID=A0A1E5Q1M4_9ACTN|nr:hypothetical protein BGK67_14010 [Streptomyces subrutilus]
MAALAGPLLLRLRRNPAFVTGRDGRLSTSTALALAWTVILVWLLLATLGYGLTAGGGAAYFQGGHGPLSPLTTVYLPLLGGPYVALIAAKAVVGMRVENGSMAKPTAKSTVSGRRPLRELIANDSGRTDLVDLQYVGLSAVTVLYVVLFFLSDVGAGLPRLPSEVWALTGAPAGAYLVNKMAVRPNPVITDVRVAEGRLTVEGGGFTRPGSTPPCPTPPGSPASGPTAPGAPTPGLTVPGFGAPGLTVNGSAVPVERDPLTGALTARLPASVIPPFTVIVTTRGLHSDPYCYEG